jgi:hypothetical protein
MMFEDYLCLVTIDFDDLLSLIMLDDYFLIANKN